MSKAFTKEPDGDDDHDSAVDEAVHYSEPPGVKNYITPDGLQRLRGERRFQLTREMAGGDEVVALAASNGDRSETADYQHGQARLRQISEQSPGRRFVSGP